VGGAFVVDTKRAVEMVAGVREVEQRGAATMGLAALKRGTRGRRKDIVI
jgi:hypothetical protein